MLSLNVFGQSGYSISGKVFSKINKQPLPNIIIRLKVTPLFGVITDSTGSFNIPNLNAGQYSLEINEFGYDIQDTTLVITNNSLLNVSIWLDADCEYDKERALQDIEQGNVKLLLIGSIVPVRYSTDKKFERKYNLAFYDFGCTPPARECVIEYNNTIFKYLDQKYQNKWRKEVRKDVIGL